MTDKIIELSRGVVTAPAYGEAEGVAAAKRRATYRGRPPSIDMEAIKHRLARGLSPTEIARGLRISRGTVHKARADMTDIA